MLFQSVKVVVGKRVRMSQVSRSRRDGPNLAQKGEFEPIIEIGDELIEVSCVFDFRRLSIILSVSDFKGGDFFFLESEPFPDCLFELV